MVLLTTPDQPRSSYSGKLTIGDEVWICLALLHRADPNREVFTVEEIRERVRRERLVEPMRTGVEQHIREHCVANHRPSPARLRYLFATSTSARRLVRPGDAFHAERTGPTHPTRDRLPVRFHDLVDWYESAYAQKGSPTADDDPILALIGLGREIWKDEPADEYVARLRANWE